MRHSDYRGLEKSVREIDEDFEGSTARSVDDHYGVPFSPNSSNEFLTDNANRSQTSLLSFVSTKSSQKDKKKKKNNNNKNSFASTKVDEEDPSFVEEEPPAQIRGRLPSRDYGDTQFDMEPDDDLKLPPNQCKFNFYL